MLVAEGEHCQVALALLLLVMLLTSVDELFATREHEVDHSGVLAGGGRVGANRVQRRFDPRVTAAAPHSRLILALLINCS